MPVSLEFITRMASIKYLSLCIAEVYKEASAIFM